MVREAMPDLALYHEGRADNAPTAPQVFDLFADATRQRLLADRELVQVFKPDLADLQRRVLGVPENADNGAGPGA